MSEPVEFTLSDGTTVLVSAPPRVGTSIVGLGGRPEGAGRTLRQVLAPITAAAADVIAEFREHTHRPEEVEVAFGVTLDTQLGAIITSVKTTAHLDVRLRWSSPPPAPDDAGTPSSGA
ncbi:CU044_2847 family protein [Streptomyces sp. NBC_01304]|uniref:CU044_2847 family protein n=1 Tax=Streptomyces sp. NBC_01304 TaxID=2903818 RepID=UPI002E1578AF|nr:hypothetical protein OG430_45940 [Streptomyces sp. NBC_01304]